VAKVKKTMRREGEESHLIGISRAELSGEGKAGNRGGQEEHGCQTG
jgi:hypothetical protein